MKKTLTVVRYALVSLFSFLFIGSACADVAEIYQPFMANFADRIMTITSSGNAGAGVDLGGAATFALFDPNTGADTTTTFQGNQSTTALPGQTQQTAAWHGWASTVSGNASKAYSAPGLVMRFPTYVSGRSITVGGTFAPFTVGGLIVEEGASSGDTIPSWTQDNNNSSRYVELGDKRTSGGVPTFFVLRDSFKIKRGNNNAVNSGVQLYGDITFDIASDKYFDCNTSKPNGLIALQSGAIFRMVGEGEFKVSTLTATGSVTLDYSKQSTQRATPFITGNLTIDGNTAIVLPEDLAENTDFELCSGTLSGATTGAREITVGDKTDFATLTFTDNKVQYVWITEKSEVTLGADKTWAEVTQLEGYKGTLPTTINLGADVEIDFAETATTPILTFKGAHKATLVYNKTPTIPEIKVADGASFEIAIPEGSDYSNQDIPTGATMIAITTATGAGINYGSSALTYTYTGNDEVTPAITGTGAFTKAGLGTIVLQATFNPASVTIAEGALKRPQGGNWAFNEKTLTVNSGAKLIMNGGFDKALYYVVAGNGPAIVQDVTGGTYGNINGRKLTLAADATFETDAAYYFINSSYNPNTIELGSYTLTKTGDATFYLCNTTVTGAGTIKVAAGTLDLANRSATMSDGTVELAGGNLNVSQAFALNKLLISSDTTLAPSANLTLTTLAIQNATADFTAWTLPIAGTIAADSTGSLKITKPTKPAKIVAGTTIPAGLTIVDENGNAIAPLCVYDGYICYGNAASGEYTLTKEDTDAIKALPAGGIYYPLVIGATSVAGVPDGFLGWMDNGAICVAQKSNSISIKLGTRTAGRDSQILTTDTSVGGFPVAGKLWNVAKVSNGNSGSPVSDYTTLWDGNGADSGARIAYYAVNTYYAANSPTPFTTGNERLLGTYLDDGDVEPTTLWTISESSDGTVIPEGSVELPATPNKRGWEVQISDIPYEMYDLYVYVASDQPEDGLKACPVTISVNNGSTWSYYAGEAKGTDGDSWSPLAYSHEGVVTEGKNYIRFRVSKNSMGVQDISTVLLSHGTRHTGNKKRLGLAGIQIVEIDDDGVRDRAVSVGETQSWHDADGWTMKTKDGDKTVIWKDSDETTPITARIDASDIPTITMDSAAIVDKLVITGEAETFAIDGEATLTANAIDATEFTGNIVFEAPVKGALSLGANAKFVVEIADDAEVSIENLLPAGLTIASGSVTITGAGTIVAENTLPVAYQPGFQVNTWTGMLWLKNIAWNSFGFGAYGHAGSKIKVTGITGYGPNSTADGVNPELILEDSGDTKAILINDGFGGKDYFFSRVSGSGTFAWDADSTKSPDGPIYIFRDVSDFDGVLDAGPHLKIVVGNTTAGTDKGSITFANGITVKASLGWAAQKAYFGETLTVKGALGDTLVEGLTVAPASVPAVTLIDAQGQTVTGDYTLKYTNVEGNGKLTIAYPDIEITQDSNENILAGVVEWDGEGSADFVNGIAKVPRGAKNVTVTYMSNFYDNYFFSDGTYEYTFDLADEVTEPLTASLPSGITIGLAVAQVSDQAHPENSRFYPTLADAITRVGVGGTISMIDDDTASTTVAKSVTINVNGFEIAVVATAEADTTITFGCGGTVGGTVTVDGGTVNFRTAGDTVIGEFTGTLNYTSGTVTKSDDYTVEPPEGYEWKEGVLVKKQSDWPSDWPADVDDAVKAKFATWTTTYGVTDFTGKEAAFLLNVDPADELPAFKIESIEVEGSVATVVISIEGKDFETETINGKLFVEAGDELEGMTDKAFDFEVVEGKATGSIAAKFIKAKVGFKAPVVE